MFIFNLKLNKNKVIKIVLLITAVLMVFLLIFSIFRIYKKANNNDIQNNNNDNENIYEINSNNYTNFLKDAHENIENYLNIKIKISGYVYRMPDFADNQFVLSRTMILNSANTGVVVGILTEYDNAKDLLDNEWVNVIGIIEKGNYKGEMPILKVQSIEKIEPPDDEYVYMPSI